MKYLKKIKKGRGIVLVIAGLFVVSGSLQLSVGLNQALRVTELEEKIAVQKKALELADFEVRRRLAALTEAEKRLRATMALADGAAEADLAQLTVVYENMKPKDAAALFEKMEPTFAAGFLSRMQPSSSAQIHPRQIE